MVARWDDLSPGWPVWPVSNPTESHRSMWWWAHTVAGAEERNEEWGWCFSIQVKFQPAPLIAPPHSWLWSGCDFVATVCVCVWFWKEPAGDLVVYVSMQTTSARFMLGVCWKYVAIFPCFLDLLGLTSLHWDHLSALWCDVYLSPLCVCAHVMSPDFPWSSI